MELAVKGATWVATASHRCVKPLYMTMSRGHFPLLFAHAISLKSPFFLKNVSKVADARFSVRFLHSSDPSV